MLDLIVLHGEFSLFTVRGNFWYQIYRNRRKKVLCSRLSLITLTNTLYTSRAREACTPAARSKGVTACVNLLLQSIFEIFLKGPPTVGTNLNR